MFASLIFALFLLGIILLNVPVFSSSKIIYIVITLLGALGFIYLYYHPSSFISVLFFDKRTAFLCAFLLFAYTSVALFSSGVPLFMYILSAAFATVAVSSENIFIITIGIQGASLPLLLIKRKYFSKVRFTSIMLSLFFSLIIFALSSSFSIDQIIIKAESSTAIVYSSLFYILCLLFPVGFLYFGKTTKQQSIFTAIILPTMILGTVFHVSDIFLAIAPAKILSMLLSLLSVILVFASIMSVKIFFSKREISSLIASFSILNFSFALLSALAIDGQDASFLWIFSSFGVYALFILLFNISFEKEGLSRFGFAFLIIILTTLSLPYTAVAPMIRVSMIFASYKMGYMSVFIALLIIVAILILISAKVVQLNFIAKEKKEIGNLWLILPLAIITFLITTHIFSLINLA